MNTDFPTSTKKLEISEVTQKILLETAKWAKFLAILGFVGIGILVLTGLFSGTIWGAFGGFNEFQNDLNPFVGFLGVFVAIFYVLIALIYYFPIKYLYDFSNKVKKAFEIQDQLLFNEAIFKLKSHYKYIGIVMIIIVSINVLMLISTLIGALVAGTLY